MNALSYSLSDSATMLRRQLRHMVRYPSLTMFVVGMPVVFLLLFVFVFGGTLGAGLGGAAVVSGTVGGRAAYLEYVTLADAMAFFVELGLELEAEAPVEGRWVDRVVGLEGVRADIATMRTPDGHARLELTKFHAPSGRGGDSGAPANAMGIRHIAFAVQGIDDVLDRLRAHGAELVGEVEQYEDSYRLCYVRGPEGIIIELAEQIVVTSR
jgi:catechol 2,3-dioxygenase-like lactoylglutathione lyase family enzyme